jgi:predicted dehydrogenase
MNSTPHAIFIFRSSTRSPILKRQNSRREFLKKSALAGVGFWVAGGATAAPIKSANEKPNIACIGVGGKGGSDTDHAAHYGNIVALCDCDDRPLREKAAKFPKAKKYNDFRKMLEEMEKQIDAVTVSTADHTHAPASIMAMKMGKHVYCQKPLTHDVYEARMMREVAAQHKVVTQMGNQGTAADGFRRGAEYIQAGIIGPVSEVHVWTNRPFNYWKQAPEITARPKETPPVPSHVHWDLFLGPAAERPYNPIYHPFHWRGWRDFGTGALGDMACHTANLAFMALKLGLPTAVSAEHSEVNPETYQAWATITYEFAARGDMPPVKLIWWEGAKGGQRNLPPAELLKGEQPSSSGSLFIGEKATLYSPNDYGARFKLLPAKELANVKDPPRSLPRLGLGDDDLHHKMEWVRAIQGGAPPMSNFGYASILTESMLLGNVAILAGKKIQYDGESGHVTNAPEAEQYLRREYRRGWTL